MSATRATRTGRRIVGAYPARWRARYADEVLALLDDRPPGWRDTLDLARGALDAHLHPAVPSRFVAWAALLAGASWAIVALAVLLEPAAPDWPGYLAWILPPAAIGALAGLAASAGLALRIGSRGGRAGRVAVAASIVGQVLLVIALVVAAAGGPYGAATGAAGSAAAVGLVLQGIATIRAGHSPEGLGLTLVGAALLLPPPIAWVGTAGTWTVLGGWLAVDRATRRSGPIGPIGPGAAG